MAANSYYNAHTPTAHEQQQQHLLGHASPLSDDFSPPSTPLKPLHLAPQTAYYHSNASSEKHDDLQHALQEDAHLKARIRRFRLFSRTLSFLISLGVLAPISMTLTTFLRTRHTYRTLTHADGTSTSRTAWAHDSRTWPTYTYFGVALASTLLNCWTIFAYKSGVRRANAVSHLSSVFSWAVMLANVVVWAVAAGVYRSEKDKGGKSDDLWGWTCSPGARAIQREFAGEVDFNMYCNVQSASWVVGVAQVGASVLTVGIYGMVFQRWASKSVVRRLEGASVMA